VFRLSWILLTLSPLLAQTPPLWLRHAAISPDGSAVVFAYLGDLYRVDAEGGLAIPLTTYSGHDTHPVYSPDGSWIAFASDRYGNMDVFVVSARGGEARRLTYHSADDFPSDFAPDGSSVLFTSLRLDHHEMAQFPYRRMPETYSVPVAGGAVDMVTSVCLDEPHYDRRGRRIVYQDKTGGEDPFRKHHTSSVTRDIWIYDVRRGTHTRVLERAGEDRSPLFSADGKSIFYLSDQDGSINVFRSDIENPRPVALTNWGDHPVRNLTRADDDTLCFSYDGELYTMKPGAQPVKLAIELRRDREAPDYEILPVTSGADEMAVSPSGREVAFVYRGDVFVTSVESAVTKQVTATPERERSVDFSPDGRSLVYAGERNNSWNIYQTTLAREEEDYFFNATVLTEKALVASDEETFQPRYSPDGEKIAYLTDRTEIRVMDLASGDVVTILPQGVNFSYLDGDQYFTWSPDSKWLLIEYLLPGFWRDEVGLARADGSGEIVNLTESGHYDSRPRWMMKGELMIWFTDRDGLRGAARSGQREQDVYGMFLTEAAWDRYNLTEEEAELLEEKEKKEKKAEKGDEKEEKEDEDEQPELVIELDGIRDRKARLTIHSSDLSDAIVTPDGEKLLYLTRFEKGHDLWQTNLRTKETKILAELGARGGRLELSKDGETLFVLSGGKISKIEVDSGKKKGIAFKGEMRLDRSAERAYLFDHVWRQVREKFYDPELHGARWDFLGAAYRRFLPHIDNEYDFQELLSELLGELNASHTGARYRHRAENADETASLAVYLDPEHEGPGLKIAEVMDKNEVYGKDSRVAAGVVIEKIDGVTITAGMNHIPLLNRKAGKYTLLTLSNGDETWEERVTPISDGDAYELTYRRWVDQRRALVDELSGGRLGYVHVRGMNDPSYRSVFEEVMGKHVTREGLIIDTRFNGGGDLVEDLVTWLAGEEYMRFLDREGNRVGIEPDVKWLAPTVVLAGESNYSDAHCFPYAFKQLGLGKVIGMPVPGTCTFVWWERLDNGITFGIPNLGIKAPDGYWLENTQLVPDILVDNEPGALARGEDQQIEAAVKELLSQLDR